MKTDAPRMRVRAMLLFGLIALSFALSEKASAQTLFVMGACDPSQPEQYQSFANDVRTIGRIVESSVGRDSTRKYCFYNDQAGSTSSVVWTGPDVTSLESNGARLGKADIFAAVKSGLRGLKGKVKPNDAVLFFWAGHGVFNENDRSHYLSMWEGTDQKRDELIAIIQESNPMLIVFLSDCCANLGNIPVQTGASERSKIKDKLLYKDFDNEITPLFDELFFNSRGLVNLNAAKEGMVAFGVQGRGAGGVAAEGFGLFTKAFSEVFEDEKDSYYSRPLSWNQVANIVDNKTQKLYDKYKREGAFRGKDGSQKTQEIGIWGLPGMNPIDFGPPSTTGPTNKSTIGVKGTGFGITENDLEKILSAKPIMRPIMDQTTESIVEDSPPEVPGAVWTPDCAPYIGDRIVEVNGIEIGDAQDYNREIAMVGPWVLLKIVEKESGKYAYLRAKVPEGWDPSYFGIGVISAKEGGAMTYLVKDGTPATKCEYWQTPYSAPIGASRRTIEDVSVLGVEWSPEAVHSARFGDRIVEVNGQPIRSVNGYQAAVAKPGSTVVLKLVEQSLSTEYYLKTKIPSMPSRDGTYLGFQVETAPEGGVYVIGVAQGSAATRCQYGVKVRRR